MNKQKMMDTHEQSVAEFNATPEYQPSKFETLIQEHAGTIKKAFCVVTPIGLALAPNVISPPAIEAQALTAAELARIRNEKAAIERQIDQLTPQIARYQQRQNEFSRNPENIRTAEEALRIAKQNEVLRAAQIWGSTFNENFRTFLCEQTRINEINRRRPIVGQIHRENIREALDTNLSGKIINVTHGTLHFENSGPAVTRARYAAWDRYPNLSDQARREQADIAGVMATRDAWRMTNIVDKRVTSVQCRPTQVALERKRSQDAQLRRELSSLRSQYAIGGGR